MGTSIRGKVRITKMGVGLIRGKLFIQFGVMVQQDEAILFTGNHGRGPGLLDLGAHVPGVVGPVGQDGLARAQVPRKQTRRLRAVELRRSRNQEVKSKCIVPKAICLACLS
jgi:hypothetical protein